MDTLSASCIVQFVIGRTGPLAVDLRRAKERLEPAAPLQRFMLVLLLFRLKPSFFKTHAAIPAPELGRRGDFASSSLLVPAIYLTLRASPWKSPSDHMGCGAPRSRPATPGNELPDRSSSVRHSPINHQSHASGRLRLHGKDSPPAPLDGAEPQKNVKYRMSCLQYVRNSDLFVPVLSLERCGTSSISRFGP
jgi:hypothetical protein